MLNELNFFRSLTERMPHADAAGAEHLAPAKESDETLSTECHRIKRALSVHFKSAPDFAMAGWEISNFQREVANMLNGLDETDGNRYIVYCLTDLFKHNQHTFGAGLSSAIALPRPLATEMRDLVASNIQAMVRQLEAKGIRQWMIAEVGSGMASLTRRAFPELTFADYLYVRAFIQELGRLAADKRNRNWQQRFFYFLLRFNFNYMGWYNAWRKEASKSLAGCHTVKDKLDRIHDWQHQLKHTTALNGMAFDPSALSLKEHLLLFLDDEKKFLEERLAQESAGLQTNRTGDELCIEFHYRHDQGKDFNYATKAEAAAAYAAVYRSKSAGQITVHSIERFDKKRLETAAISYHRRLKKIDEQLVADFGLRS